MIEVHSQTLFGPQVRDLAFRPPAREAKCEFVINMRTAKMLGLTVLPSLLLRADEVIE